MPLFLKGEIMEKITKEDINNSLIKKVIIREKMGEPTLEYKILYGEVDNIEKNNSKTYVKSKDVNRR